MPVSADIQRQAAEAAAELPGPNTGTLNAGEKMAAAANIPADGSTLALAALDRALAYSPSGASPQEVTGRADAYLAWLKEQA